jgi:hypothetical protein
MNSREPSELSFAMRRSGVRVPDRYARMLERWQRLNGRRR